MYDEISNVRIAAVFEGVNDRPVREECAVGIADL